jgi:imidazolonepropionase-like amidohydrolase
MTSKTESPGILFENATVFDGVTPRVAAGLSVLVEGGEIKRLAAQPIEVDGVERIDCTGKTLMPGMIDNHVHIYAQGLPFTPPEPPITYRAQYAQKFLGHMLSCGFTAVRDVAGGDHGMAMALRDGFLDGPRFFYGGLALSQTGGHGDFRDPGQSTDFCACCSSQRNAHAIHADGIDECVKATREELRKGAHHIKIMASGGVLSQSDPLERCQYSEREIRAIVEECERHGAYVCAHCHPVEAIRRCVEYGVRSIEHGTMIDAETAAFVAEKGAYVIPTLASVFALKENGRKAGLTEASYQKLLVVYRRGVEGLAIMKRAGVKIGFGTDLIGADHTLHGLEFTVRKQVLSAFDILHSATAVNAEILGMQGKLGVVKAGAYADLLVIEGNPLENIDLLAANGDHITHIMAGGHFVKRPPAAQSR